MTGLGIYHFNARFYSPKLGRFLSADTITPSGPQGLNRYSYVGNNPVNFNDPTGHRPCGDGEKYDCDGRLNPTSPSTTTTTTTTTAVNPQKDKDPDPNPSGIVPLQNSSSGEPDPVVTLLNNASTTLDIIAWSIDLFNVGVVTYGGIFGAGIGAPFALGGPEVPVATGLVGIGIAELAVQPSLQLANGLALISTVFTIVADVRSGDTNIEQGVIATTTLNSVTTTLYGYSTPEAYLSLGFQSIAVANDLGWTSFPFSNGSK